jgi:hypothetical protein
VTAAVAWADAHGLPRGRVESREKIQGRPRRDLRVSRQLEIPRGRRQVTVPQQALDRVEIDPRFQAVGGKAMTPMPHPA